MITLLHKDWAVTVWTAAGGKDGIAKANALRLSRRWVDSVTYSEIDLVIVDSTAREAKCIVTHAFVDYPLSVLHGLEHLKCKWLILNR